MIWQPTVKQGFRLVQAELHRHVIDLVDRLDDVGRVHAVEVLIRATRPGIKGMLRIELGHEAEDHINSVEVARWREVVV